VPFGLDARKADGEFAPRQGVKCSGAPNVWLTQCRHLNQVTTVCFKRKRSADPLLPRALSMGKYPRFNRGALSTGSLTESRQAKTLWPVSPFGGEPRNCAVSWKISGLLLGLAFPNILTRKAYYRPRPKPAEDMRRIDEVHLDYPFALLGMLRCKSLPISATFD